MRIAAEMMGPRRCPTGTAFRSGFSSRTATRASSPKAAVPVSQESDSADGLRLGVSPVKMTAPLPSWSPRVVPGGEFSGRSGMESSSSSNGRPVSGVTLTASVPLGVHRGRKARHWLKQSQRRSEIVTLECVDLKPQGWVGV